MAQLVIGLLIMCLGLALTTIGGYKAKEGWDKLSKSDSVRQSERALAAKHVDITIEFEPKPPYIIKTRLGSDAIREYFPIYYLRFKIRNNSSSFTARNTHTMLTRVFHEREGQYFPEANFEPVRLEWDDNYSHDMNPKTEALAPFGRVAHPNYQLKYEAHLYSGDPRQPQFRFPVPNYPRWMSSHVPPGRHRFTVAVNVDGEPPIEQLFELDWSGKWSDDLNSMLGEIKVKKIENASTT